MRAINKIVPVASSRWLIPVESISALSFNISSWSALNVFWTVRWVGSVAGWIASSRRAAACCWALGGRRLGRLSRVGSRGRICWNRIVGEKHLLGVVHQRVSSLIAKRSVEIINVDCPPHNSSKSVALCHVYFDADALLIVVSDPIAVSISVRHLGFIVIDTRPSSAELLADFVVREVAWFAGISSSCARIIPVWAERSRCQEAFSRD